MPRGSSIGETLKLGWLSLFQASVWKTITQTGLTWQELTVTLVVAVTGVPAGRIADRYGAQRMTFAGLIGIAAGSFALFLVPASMGIPGYLAPMVVITMGYALFQTANNTAVMTGIGADQRGVISGMLNLSRNLGLVTGASAMGAVFAFASGASDITAAAPDAVAAGMRITFAVAAALIVVALAIKAGRRLRVTN